MPEIFKRTESLNEEAAPAYDDVIHIHPVNGFAHASSSSGYAPVPQTDVEHEAPAHAHTEATLQPPQETLAQTIAGVFRPKPHTHCEECDKQLERRERRASERHCCNMVAWVFIVLFICLTIFGIVLSGSLAKARRHGHR